MAKSSGEYIDMLFSQLLTMSMDDKYEFQALRGDWGNTNSAKYNDMLARFCRNIREIGRAHV